MVPNKSTPLKNTTIFQVGLLSILLLISACKNDCPYGYGSCLSNENVQEEAWLLHTFTSYAEKKASLSKSLLSIRISKRSVMKGFIATNGIDRQGAFFKLLHIFSDFKSNSNPNGKTEYIFFDGSGKLHNDTTSERLQDETKLFDPANYSSPTNDLHHQFRNLAEDLKQNNDKNKFYVIFSDGETTIRSNVRQNTNESTVIKDAVKDMLAINPDLQIGIISILASFFGKYTYDPGNDSLIQCKRYLYAYCFFDKRFLPIYNRFCQLNKINGGNNFLFNPQFSNDYYTTKYTYKIDGQENLAQNNRYAAYPVAMDGNDLHYQVNNQLLLTDLHFTDSLKVLFYQHQQSDSLRFLKKGLVTQYPLKNLSKTDLIFPHLTESAIYNVQYIPIYNLPPEKFVPSFLAAQHIDDNTLQQIRALAPTDILPTEGLMDYCQMILEALQVSPEKPIINNYFIFSKVN